MFLQLAHAQLSKTYTMTRTCLEFGPDEFTYTPQANSRGSILPELCNVLQVGVAGAWDFDTLE
jgi:hypothetical protein